jgi:hypothetical protein
MLRWCHIPTDDGGYPAGPATGGAAAGEGLDLTLSLPLARIKKIMRNDDAVTVLLSG